MIRCGYVHPSVHRPSFLHVQGCCLLLTGRLTRPYAERTHPTLELFLHRLDLARPVGALPLLLLLLVIAPVILHIVQVFQDALHLTRRQEHEQNSVTAHPRQKDKHSGRATHSNASWASHPHRHPASTTLGPNLTVSRQTPFQGIEIQLIMYPLSPLRAVHQQTTSRRQTGEVFCPELNPR